MKTLSLLLSLLVATGCVTDESETIELTATDGKADGRSWTVITLEPGQSIHLGWTCNEWLELNGCDTTLGIKVVTKLDAGTAAATLVYTDYATGRENEHTVVAPGTSFLIEAPAVSAQAAKLTNTLKQRMTFSILATWE